MDAEVCLRPPMVSTSIYHVSTQSRNVPSSPKAEMSPLHACRPVPIRGAREDTGESARTSRRSRAPWAWGAKPRGGRDPASSSGRRSRRLRLERPPPGMVRPRPVGRPRPLFRLGPFHASDNGLLVLHRRLRAASSRARNSLAVAQHRHRAVERPAHRRLRAAQPVPLAASRRPTRLGFGSALEADLR